jgi:hypothetical protein
MGKSRKELGMKCAVCGVVLAMLLVVGLGSVVYAQEAPKPAEATRVAGASFLDPFLLTRVALAPSSVSVRGVYAAAVVTTSNGTIRSNANRNGNLGRPPRVPMIPVRPQLRSNWAPAHWELGGAT